MRFKSILLKMLPLLLLALLITQCEEALNPVVEPENSSIAGLLEDCFNNINGTVWVDSNQDGVIDAEEVLFTGVNVFLVNAVDETLSVITDENGYFEFTGICAGSYELEFEVPEGYDHLSPDEVDLLFESIDDIISVNLALFIEEEVGDDDDDDDDDDGELLEGDDDDDCETVEATARQAIDDALLALSDTTLFFDGDLSGLDLTKVYEKLAEAAEKLAEAEEKFIEGKYCDVLDKVEDANDKMADALEKYDDILEGDLEGDDDDDDDNNNEKVTICHNGHNLTISVSALQAHLNHGDSGEPCVDGENECVETFETVSAAIVPVQDALDIANSFFSGEFPGLDLTEILEKLAEAIEKLEDAEEKLAEEKYCDALKKVQDADDKIDDAYEEYNELLEEDLEGDDDDDDDDDDEETVIVCHKGKTKTIPVSALDHHLGHGDTEGACVE